HSPRRFPPLRQPAPQASTRIAPFREARAFPRGPKHCVKLLCSGLRRNGNARQTRHPAFPLPPNLFDLALNSLIQQWFAQRTTLATPLLELGLAALQSGESWST